MAITAFYSGKSPEENKQAKSLLKKFEEHTKISVIDFGVQSPYGVPTLITQCGNSSGFYGVDAIKRFVESETKKQAQAA